jgi:hypothetical protein
MLFAVLAISALSAAVVGQSSAVKWTDGLNGVYVDFEFQSEPAWQKSWEILRMYLFYERVRSSFLR